MKNQIAANTTSTEALLEGLIAECHAIIRQALIPAVREADGNGRSGDIDDIATLMKTAVKLADAVGRLRGTAPVPELRQRITVERVQRLPVPGG